jgi:predicted PurR-regulated permease PerM
MRFPRWFRDSVDRPTVPRGVQVAAAWSWRFVAVVAALAVAVLLIIQLSFIVVPLLIAVLLAVLAAPIANWLKLHWIPAWLSTFLTLVVFLSAITGLVWLVVEQILRDWSSLQDKSVVAYEDFILWLVDSPLHITEMQLNEWWTNLADQLNLNSAWILSGALSISSSLGSVVVGTGLALFALVFFVHDGERIVRWLINLLPQDARAPVAGATQRGWVTLTNFVGVQIFVALIDAIGIGLGAFFLGLPLVIPIAVAVFLGGFVPIIGAFIAGGLAAFIALVYEGPIAALIMVVIVLAVQQLEGQILQPLVMGAAVKIHPLAVVLAVSAGGFLAGIPGVLFAVPVVAYLNVFISYLAKKEWVSDPAVTKYLTPKVGL